MTDITLHFSLAIEGDDLDAKTAKKLNPQDKLILKRLDDQLDSFEIVICTAEGKELDMLSYPESLGLAPYIDQGSVTFQNASLDNMVFTPGKVRAKDMTRLNLTAHFSFDEAILVPYHSQSGTFAFMPSDNRILAMANFAILDYETGPIEQTYLNCYVLDIDLDEDSRPLFPVSYEENQDYFFCAQALFNEAFTKCRITAKVYSGNDSFNIDLEAEETAYFLELINHYRIFLDQEPIICEIEE